MQIIFKFTFVFALLLGSWGAYAVDRRPMVSAVEKILPVLLEYVEHLKETKDRDGRDLRILKEVIALAKGQRVPIYYSSNTEEFNLNPGEPMRLMRATGAYDTELNQLVDPGAIFVNETLLNSDEHTIDLSLLIKLLFHEYAHKTGEENWGVRDRLAQYFISQIDPFITQEKLNSEIDLIVLSLPISKIEKEFVPTSINRPQPTNLILVRRGDEMADITDNLYKKMDTSTEMLRSMWSEMNSKLMAVAREFIRVIDQQVKPKMSLAVDQMKQFMNEVAPENKIDYSGLDSFFDLFNGGPKDLRVLELNELQKAEMESGIFVNMRSTYFVGRTQMSNFHFNITGFPYTESYPVPTTIHFVVPKDPTKPLNEIEFDVQVRPDVDYQNVAKVQSVIRQGPNTSTMKLRILKSEKLRALNMVALSCRFPGGFQLVPAKEIRNADGGWEVTFDFGPEFYSQQVSFVADSLLLNGDHAIYLDRLVTLSEGLNGSAVVESNVEFLSGSVGFWGLEKGQPAFKSQFSRQEMVYYLDNLNMEPFSFNPSNFTVEFKLNQNVKIREVRVYLNRQMFLMDISAHGPAHAMTYQGKWIPISNQGGNLHEKKDFQEILSFSQSRITKDTALNPNTGQAETTYRATTVAPMKFDFNINRPNVAYGPPLAWPIMVEVITEDLQVLRHHFSNEVSEPSCDSFLNL